MDWPRFWGQFTETIDKTSVAPITKFSYLRELLDFKVKRTIEALPFTSEGYNRAKSILVEKYGKESEIVILTYGWELLLEQQQILQAENLYTDLTYPLLLLAIEV